MSTKHKKREKPNTLAKGNSSAHVQQTFALALSLHQKGQLAQAQVLYEQVLQAQARNFDALHLLGVIAAQTKQTERAVRLIGEAITINSQNAGFYMNYGNALQDLNQHQAALESFDRAIALKPDFADAYSNRGNSLLVLGRYQAALESFDKAIALKPDHAVAYNNRGNALLDLRRHHEALQSYERAIALKPDYEYLHGTILNIKLQLCDWKDLESQCKRLEEKVRRNEKAAKPFPFLAITTSLALQRKVSEIWVQDKYPVNHTTPEIHKLPRHDKIRIGYFSADFHNHATSYLMAELFERHDKTRFELIAFSFGPDKNDEMRKRVVAAFDKFIDARSLSDRDIALMSRKLEVDIAVDLKGYTKDARTGIFSLRAAPVQVNYLGYPGTMGAEYIDYLLADSTVVPESSMPHYSEKIACLPNSYQPNDAKRHISDRKFTRDEAGLPQSGFVFCCFNNNYKITPHSFDVWMRILKQVEGSVLWLLEDNPTASGNLRKEAVQRGVNEERLIFANPMPLPEHLARLQLADLFLDTLPYNAHTTASDSLWAGVPVMTCVGEAFASRVAASLLNAIHLPELITSDLEEYEVLAIGLATDPARFMEIREKLARNRLSAPLFDTRLFTRHIEAAYTAMYERYQSDMPPGHITNIISS